MVLSLVDSTHVDFTFIGNHTGAALPGGNVYAFSEMAANLNTAGFTNYGNWSPGQAQLISSAVTYTSAPGVTKVSTPFNLSFSGNMDGFGNFDLHQNPNNPGADDAMVLASFELTRTTGTWTSEDTVLALNNKSNYVSDHLIYNGGDTTGYTNDTSHCTVGASCVVPTPFNTPVPEPMTLAIFGTSAMGLMLAKKKGRKKLADNKSPLLA